jgi:hypothetical protein
MQMTRSRTSPNRLECSKKLASKLIYVIYVRQMYYSVDCVDPIWDCGACGESQDFGKCSKFQSTSNFGFRNPSSTFLFNRAWSFTLGKMVAFSRAAFPSQLSVARPVLCRRIHSSPLRSAVAHPVTAHGPPPKAPATPSVEFKETSSNAELPTSGGEASRYNLTAALKKRFWKDVHVHGKSGMGETSIGCLSP